MQKYSIEILTPGKKSLKLNYSKNLKYSLYNNSDYDIRDEIAQLKNYRQAIRARVFDDNNLIDCRCVNILIKLYSEIIEHNHEIGIFYL